MSIMVQNTTGEAFAVVTGLHRLKASLKVFGKVSVTDVETGECFEAHDVDGQVFALQRPGQAVAETAAVKAIRRAARS